MKNDASLDERSVSWKVLLPSLFAKRILTVGLDAGGIVGLARTCAQVDYILSDDARERLKDEKVSPPDPRDRIRHVFSLQHSLRGYDAIILGAWPWARGPAFTDLAGLLARDGVIVCLGFAGCAASRRFLRHAGFGGVQEYAALPRGQPRVFFPTESHRLRSKGLQFHVPGSIRARRAVAFGSLLSRIGLRFPFTQNGLVIAARDPALLRREGLVQWLSQTVGWPIDGSVVYAGSDSPNRRITALAAGKRPHKDVVVRIADTLEGESAIRRETAALRALSSSPVRKQVPRVLHEGDHGPYFVQVQRVLPYGRCRQVHMPTQAHLEFLVELSNLGRVTIPLCRTGLWQRLRETAARLMSTSLPPPVRSSLQEVLGPAFASKPVVCHRTHGDFVPWNIRLVNGRLYVFDWEESQASGLALTDLLHFVWRRASLEAPWRGADQAVRVLRDLGRPLAAATDCPPTTANATFRVWMVYEYLTRPSPRLIELCGYFSQEQQINQQRT